MQAGNFQAEANRSAFVEAEGRWGSDRLGDTTYTNIYVCFLETRFGCSCQLRVTNSPAGTTLEMRGTHDATSHAPEKDQSKFLKVQQIEAIRAGVRVAPKQSAKHLRRNMIYSSPPKSIGPDLARSVERRVRLFRAQLTEEKLEKIRQGWSRVTVARCHVNNPIYWAIIPEKTEGRITYAETWLLCVQEAAINALSDYKCCDDISNCDTCFMVHDLRSSPRVRQLMQKKSKI